jgi:inorganic pyrophosphatase
MTRHPILSVFILAFIFFSCDDYENTIATHDFLHDFEALSQDGLANIVVEIPAGSNQKWEVDKNSGYLKWEITQDTLRVIPYLPYPANYGMVPKTWLPAEVGGDDDPIDIFLLGPAHERGAVIPGRIIGVIKMLDGGEQDDKLIAVDPNSWFWNIYTLEELKSKFPGVLEVLTTWISNYKGDGIIQFQYVGDEQEAKKILDQAIHSYKEIIQN